MKNHHYYSPLGASLGRTEFINNEELLRQAPAAGADHASEITSESYSFISTIEVIDALRDCGFEPVSARQSGTRDPKRKGYERHEIRLRQSGQAGELKVGDVSPDIVLTNSHDTGTSFRVNAGLYRAVCSNGLLVADSTIETVAVRHVGLEIQDVINAVEGIANRLPEVLETAEKWGNIEVDDTHRRALIRAGAAARWDEDSTFGQILTDESALDRLLRPRRYGDKGTDLWTAYNVAQENLLRGGSRLTYRAEDERGYTRRRSATVREVKGLDSDRTINQALWHAADEIGLVLAN